MKTMKISLFLLATTLLLQSNLIAQTTETFFEDLEDEISESLTFAGNGQEFRIISGEERFDISNSTNSPLSGWNPELNDRDARSIDNTVGGSILNNGSNVGFATANGADITVHSFFLFISTRILEEPDPFALTIEGIRDGEVVYTIIKTDGFSDISTFEPNSGFTFIDFATEGEEDYSVVSVDEINIQTTGNSDFLRLDYIGWGPESNLSAGDFSLEGNNINVFPNPAIDAITVSGITERENYRIYNVLGAEIANGSISNNESINIQNLSSGLYLLDIDNGNNIKFLKE